MAIRYTVEGRQDDVRVTFDELPTDTVFLRVERRAVAPPEPFVPPPPPVVPPELQTPSVGAASNNMWPITISWTNTTDETVTLQRRLNQGLWVSVVTDTALTTVTDVVPRGRYDYRLLFEGKPLPSVTAIAGRTPPVLTLVSSTEFRGSNLWSVRISWTNNPVVFVHVERRRNGVGSWVRLISSFRGGRFTDSDSLAASDIGRLEYRVVNEGVASNVVETVIGTEPPAPTATAISSAGSLSVSLSWVFSGAVNVDRRNNGSEWEVVSTSNTSGGYSETVTNEGLYEYRIVSGGVASLPVSPTIEEDTGGDVARTDSTVKVFPRTEVTGCMANGEMFNLPRVVGDIRGADGDTNDWIWIVETRPRFAGTVVLRYNPVSGQGWLFTTTEVSSPNDIASSTSELYIAEGNTIHRFSKPTGPTGDAPLGVLQKTSQFTLSGTPSGIGFHGSSFYAMIGSAINAYSASGSFVRTAATSRNNIVGHALSVGAYGLFTCSKGTANPVTFFFLKSDGSWQVLQTETELRVAAVATTSDRVFLVDREAGIVTPYTVFTPAILSGYTDLSAPLETDLEYLVSAQDLDGNFESGDWQQ